MLTLSLSQALDISFYEMTEWLLPPHKHHFYEMVYVMEGSGIHLLNGNQISYAAGSLFLLTPADVHAFEIAAPTAFCFIIFNEIYFSPKASRQAEGPDFGQLFRKLELIFQNASQLLASPITAPEDKAEVDFLVRLLMREATTQGLFYETVLQNSIFLLLNLVARHIQRELGQTLKAIHPRSEIGAVFGYVQQHIYNKEALRIAAIADHFHKSKHYLGQYFKAHTGQSLKAYILDYKINLGKVRLRHSALTVAQIAEELGFTDESHFNKTFKQALGMSARQFRVRQEAGEALAERPAES
jgi:AraC family transcriptional regulator, L-rhamnose operon regulatory protein RhaS